MHIITKALMGLVAVSAVATAAHARDATLNSNITVNDPPGPRPDPGHFVLTMPANVQWSGDPKGEQLFKLFGDSHKPGAYGELARWPAGAFSELHMHDKDRYTCVISGTWWVGSSVHIDPKLAYPVTAGNCGRDIANTVYWDGARAGGPPVILYRAGMGPVKATPLDKDGKPKP